MRSTGSCRGSRRRVTPPTAVLSLKDGALHLDWDIEKSTRAIEAVVRTHEKFARSTGGMPLVPLTWTLDEGSDHPASAGRRQHGHDARRTGSSITRVRCSGIANLYVADGAIVPEAMGLNPSKTIAALAERIAALIAAEGR